MRISVWISDVCLPISGRAAVRRAEALRQRLRARVGGVDAVHQLGPFQKFDREIAGGDGAFEGIALAGEFGADAIADLGRGPAVGLPRSEEHTSELQSLMRNSYAVFCLKKKKKTINT